MRRHHTAEECEFFKREAVVQAAFDVPQWLADLSARGIRVSLLRGGGAIPGAAGTLVCVPCELMQPTDWHAATRFERKIVAWLRTKRP